MKMEDHFKETLHRAVANEPPVFDAWDRFEHRIGRARRWRMAAALAGAAAVIVAAVIVVPNLATNGGVGFDTPPPDPYAGWQSGSDPIGQWTVLFPADWRLTQFEGTNDILPPGEKGTAAGEPTFAVYIARIDEDLEPNAAFEDPTIKRGVWPGGRPYLRIELRPPDNSVQGYTYRIDWRTPCAFEAQPCDVAPSTLVVQVIEIGNEGRFAMYAEDGELVARSIRYLDVPPPSAPTPSS